MLYEEVKAFRPYNEQERADRELILSFLQSSSGDKLFSPDTPAHFTVSAWVTNSSKTRVLMVFHNIFRSWSWSGGHADSPEHLSDLALRKARQETGSKTVRLVSEKIYSLEVIASSGYYTGERYIPSNLHLNLTYLLEADEEEPIHVDEQENCGVKWFDLRRAATQPNGAWIRSIYEKLNEKLSLS